MPDQRLFITGATSHTGCHLVRRLAQERVALRCLTRSREKGRQLPPGDHELAQGDLKDIAGIAELLSGCAAVLHLGHIKNAHLIVEACQLADVRRLIVISSTRKYTRFPDAISQSVIEGEEAVLASGLDWTMLRPSMIFGDARDGNIAGLLAAVRSRSLFPLIGGGRALMQPLFVEDLVEAIVGSWLRPETAGRDYDLAGPEPLPLRRVLEILREESGAKTIFIPVPRFLALPAARALDLLRGRRETGRAAQVRRLGEDKSFDITPAQRDLGFAPRSFADAVRRKIEWLKEGK